MTTMLQILQHALGRDEFGQRKKYLKDDYRNHFCTYKGGRDWELCEEATAIGLMVKHRPREITGGMWTFSVTAAGVKYIEEYSPKPPSVSRSRARYLAWLDADVGLSFGEWLKGGYYG